MNSALPFADDDIQFPVPGMVVLSEDSFSAALDAAVRQGRDGGITWAPVDPAAVEEGAIIAGRANHPGTRGLVARVRRRQGGPEPFSGRLFGIVTEPAFAADGRLVSATRFRIATIELTGTAEWVGGDARLSGTRFAVTPDVCCGKSTVCLPAPDDGDDPPVYMPSSRVGIATHGDDIYTARERERPEGGSVRYTAYSGGLPGQQGPVIAGPGGLTPADPSGGGFGGGLPTPLGDDMVCVDRLDPDCGIAKPICGPDDVGYSKGDDDAADIPLGSSSCAGEMTRPVRGLNVPEACTYAYFGGDTTDPACLGTYGGPPNRSQIIDTTTPSGAWDVTNSLLCRVARWVPGSGSPCETQTDSYKLARTLALQLELGGVLPGEEKTLCTDTGKRGIQYCVTCTSESCSESVVVPPVDPAVAGGEQKAKKDLTIEADVSDTSWTYDPFTGSSSSTTTTQTISTTISYGGGDPAPPAGDPPKEKQPAPGTPPGPKEPKDKPAPPPTPGQPPPRPEPQDRPTHGNDDSKKNTRDKNSFTQPKRQEAKKGGDPVEYGDGSLLLDQTDLHFPGPVRPLTFTRSYRSGSRDRSAMGSNWRHNWDVHLQVYDEQTLPSWLSPWCGGLPGSPTALAVHWGDSSSDLFLLDIETRLFLPQAGSAATVAKTTTGWAMRFPDGRILVFDEAGCLCTDTDRFGNRFALDWEPTPLGRLFDYFCTPARLAAGNETLASRRNSLLAWLVGAGPRPDADRRFWELTAVDFPMPADPAVRAELEYARDYLLFLAALPYPAESIDGGTRRRVRRVTDPIGRTFDFAYKSASAYAANPGPSAFVAALDAGLLETVRGPVGTSVTFRYNRPAGYPEELNEAFLISVLRSDTLPAGVANLVAAPDRETTFEYQWPGGAVPSYDGFASVHEATYAAFYKTFVGCRFDGVYVCEGAQQLVAEWAPGNPAFLARLARNAYISDVADNILTVTHVNEIEIESRYPADPADLAFDQVVAQRYGSSSAVQDPVRVPPDGPGDAWRTAYPKATLAYCIAGPVAGGADRTDGFLPSTIRTRYPLEVAPPVDPPVPPARSKTGGCDYAQMEILRTQLPGYRELLPYFDQPGDAPLAAIVDPTVGGLAAFDHPLSFGSLSAAAEAPPRLWRTPLASEQLAGAQLWDPAHNDLLSGQVPNPADTTRPIIERIVGRRRIVAQNNNRICAWVRRTDRDGDIAYFGLNYRGLALVEATQEAGGGFVYIDRFYNADGNLIEERRPTRDLSPWKPGEGRTLFVYDEIDPTANRGWNAWLPVFWSRRYNLLRVEVQAIGEVLDSDEQGNFRAGSGRFTQYRYEPLFNQVLSIVSGSIAPGGRVGRATLPPVLTISSVTANIFDYQELSATVVPTDPNSIDPLLDTLRPWGFHWLRSDPAAFAFQLPVPLIGGDINRDAASGNRFASVPAERGVGLPILHLQGRPGGAFRNWYLRWSPHGKVSRIDGPDGESTRFEFYPVVAGNLDASLGTGTPPSDADVQAGSSGYLGRIVQRVISPLTYAIPPLTGTASLAGPYAFLGIDAATTPANLPSALAGLGLPTEQIDDLIATLGLDPPAAFAAQGVSYNRAGHPMYVFLANGTATIVTDTDGRLDTVTDARGSSAATDYDLQRRPVRQTTRDAAGTLLHETLTVYDEGDNVVMAVEALVPGAATDPPPAADAVVWRYSFTPEGDLSETIAPEGLRIRYAYDPFKRVVLETSIPASVAETRTTAHRYDVSGRLELTIVGGPSRRGPTARQEFTYDGLDRLISFRDERGYRWQHAWSYRDLLTHHRRHDEPYGRPIAGAPSRELRYKYDDFGDLIEQRQNNFIGVSLRRSRAGRVLSATSAGLGTTYAISDLFGRPLWRRTPDGTELVVTRREQPHREVTSVARRDDADTPRTVSTLVELDPLGAATKDVRIGGTHRVETRYSLDGAGRVDALRGPNGENVRVRRNLAGWITRNIRVSAGGAIETIREYDRRGLLTRLRDAAGQEARFGYDAFGALTSARLNGTPAVTATRAYDRLGRVVRSTDGAFDIVHRYDAHHDPIEDVTAAGVVLSRRNFDDLGRLSSAEHTNLGLGWLAETDRTVRSEFFYDRLDRVSHERTELFGRVSDVEQTWTATAGGWRAITLATMGAWNMTWETMFDTAGRFASRGPAGQSWLHTQFNWLGDVYVGRSQTQPGFHSRFVESIEVDALLLSRRVSYRAIETDAQGRPNFNADALKYSPAGWDDVLCSLPLLDMTTVRDRVGRAAIEVWRHAHPVTTLGGLQSPLPARLRALSYTSTGRLASSFEIDALTIPLPPLQSYDDPAAAIAAIAAGASVWTYDRTTETEDLTSITDAAGNKRFAATTARSLAHQLTRVEVDGQVANIHHDSGGRIVTDGLRTFTWHPDGRLATASRGGAFQEGFAYDGLGRLVGLYISNQNVRPPDVRLIYDHEDPIGAVADVRPIWYAAWGPLSNQLVEWEDSGGGVRIPLLDGRGSPLALWDPVSATVPAANTFTPEGRIAVRDGNGTLVCEEAGTGAVCVPAGLPFGFAGAFRSAITGLVWMRARWYDPALAQFVSMDPGWFLEGTNLYEYATGDPINRIDPTGFKSRENAKPKPKPNRVVRRRIESQPKASLPGGGGPKLPVEPPAPPPPAPAAPVKLPKGGMSDAEREILRRVEELQQKQTPRERAEKAEEQARRGWRDQTRELEFKELLDTSPVHEQLIYELGDHTGGNDAAVGLTGEDKFGDEVSLPDRIIAGASGVLKLLDTATTPMLAGGMVKRTGKAVMVEIAPGVFRPGIRMPKARFWQNKSEGGYLRDSRKYWRWMNEHYPELFSEKNREFIRKGWAPEVDDEFLKAFPEYELMKGDLLEHHHWNKGADTIGLPQFLHDLWHGELHYYF